MRYGFFDGCRKYRFVIVCYGVGDLLYYMKGDSHGDNGAKQVCVVVVAVDV